MSIIEIIEIALIIITVVLYAFMVYFKAKGNVIAAVSELIALAEKTGLTGSEKMAQVVGGLYEKVPVALKKILDKETLQNIAQWVFDWMRKYAEAYIEAAETKEDEQLKEAAVEISADALAELVGQLINAKLSELQAKANELGIEDEGLKTKQDYATAIVKASLEKA